MGSIISVANSVGAIKVGKTSEHANTGHAPRFVSVATGPESYVIFERGDHYDAGTRIEKSQFNSDLMHAGWQHHVHHDCLVHTDTGATLDITRNFWVDAYTADARKVVARYTRSD